MECRNFPGRPLCTYKEEQSTEHPRPDGHGRTKVHAGHTMKLQLTNPYSKPKAVRKSKNRDASAVKRPDETKMARWHMREVAIEEVADIVDKEAEKMASKEGGFHLETKKRSWAFVYAFTIAIRSSLLREVRQPSSVSLSQLHLGRRSAPSPKFWWTAVEPMLRMSRMIGHWRGKGKNRQDPWMVSKSHIESV